MKQSHWLVTGGAGFIGSHIVERLLKEGQYVRVLDNFYSGKEENLVMATSSLRGSPPSLKLRRVNSATEAIPKTPNFELIRGDIRDYDTCLKACEGIDYILHQAALRSVPKSMEIPHKFNAVNIDGSLNILEAALKQKVKRVVAASSSSVFGEAKAFPQKETDASLLISPYALSKLTVEYYSRIFSLAYGLETVNLRYFNVFGPRQALDDEYAVVIPKFITCMLKDENPPIHGDGKQSRDFTYIDTVVEANILSAITTPSSLRGSTAPSSLRASAASEAISTNKTFCEVFNVALGEDHSVLELVDVLNKIMGKNIKPRHTPPRAGDVLRTCADTSKMTKMLNFKPKVTFEDGLKKTVEWFTSSLRGA